MSQSIDEFVGTFTVQIFHGRRLKVFGAGTDADWTAALKNEVESALESALEGDYIGGRYVDEGGRLMDDPPAEVYGEPGSIPVTIELPKD
jgi:hypothetical protein